jgi:hypothetical protein
MNQPIAPTNRFRRASLSEATLTAQQWVCCAASVGTNPWAWQQSLYRAAYQAAAQTVEADRQIRSQANWN